jgi:hypothetical protein
MRAKEYKSLAEEALVQISTQPENIFNSDLESGQIQSPFHEKI